MKAKFFLLSLLGLMLVGCGKSKQSQFYVLNPICSAKSTVQYTGLKIGIDSIAIPAYLSKNQIPLFYTANQATLYETHEWAEDLEKNTKRVIATNLAILLPGAVVENAPWDSKFKPDYTVQVNISQWSVAVGGQSQLQASYVIFNETAPLYQKSGLYCQHIPKVLPETIVLSMNSNLTKLTQDIARSIQTVRGR